MEKVYLSVTIQEIANNFKFKISIPISIQFIIYLVRQSVNHATKYKYKKIKCKWIREFSKIIFFNYDRCKSVLQLTFVCQSIILYALLLIDVVILVHI